jgi:hypothetical protein
LPIFYFPPPRRISFCFRKKSGLSGRLPERTETAWRSVVF